MRRREDEAKARRALARRFSHNLERLMKAAGVSQADLGRKLDPNHKNPAALVNCYLKGLYFPNESSRERFAQALGVTEMEFHQGELGDFEEGGEGKAQRPMPNAPRRMKRTARGSAKGKVQTAKCKAEEADGAGPADGMPGVLLAACDSHYRAQLANLQKFYDECDALGKVHMLVKVTRICAGLGL